MKPSMAKLPLLSLLLAMAATCALCNDAVLDTDGNPLRPGSEYFIAPSSGANTGGLVPAPRNFFRICPLDVVQTLLNPQPGQPISFVLTDNRDSEIITLSSDINIEFEAPLWVCPSSKVWTVDYTSPEKIITTGGILGSGNGLFRIEKHESGNGYKLVHPESDSSKSRNVGLFEGDFGIPRLALRDEALPLAFRAVKPKVSRLEGARLRMFPYY